MAEGILAELDGPLVNLKAAKQRVPIIFPDFGLGGPCPPDLQGEENPRGSISRPNPFVQGEGEG